MAAGVSQGGEGGSCWHSCGGVLWVLGATCIPPEPTTCPLQPEGEKWGGNQGNRALPQAAVGGDRGHQFARAPHSVAQHPQGDPCPGTGDSSTLTTMCGPQCWHHPWGSLVAPLPLRAVAMAVWGPGPVRSRASGSGGPEGPPGQTPVGEGGHMLVAEGTFPRWGPSCLCVWAIDFPSCVWCPGDIWVRPC